MDGDDLLSSVILSLINTNWDAMFFIPSQSSVMIPKLVSGTEA